MQINRSFNFPVSTLIRDAKLLLACLRDPGLGAPVLARLTTSRQSDPAGAFAAQIETLEKGGTHHSSATGTVNQLTQAQALALTELERLMAAARRSGGLFLPDGDPRLRSEFQVGNHEPRDLGSELDRARQMVGAVTKYADDLADFGWVAADTTALIAAIETLAGGDDDQVAAKGRRKALAASRNEAANALYKRCLVIQNAARLAYPNTRTDSATVVEARARFLLDTFPPTTGASAGDPPAPALPAATTTMVAAGPATPAATGPMPV